jgi:hypothetical protein
MKLDSDEQRGLLLQIIQGTPLQGSYSQVSGLVKKIDKLADAILKAEIEETQDE